ncbi:hypothetical protein ACLBXM_10140 [Xanthobacteraceae bacterium A53D]
MVAGLAVLLAGAAGPAAAGCLEEIVALQNRLPNPPVDGGPSGPSASQSVGAQLDRQPTPGSVAAAGGNTGPQTGAAGYLNKAQNLQAAGDEKGCMQAVGEARKLLDGK